MQTIFQRYHLMLKKDFLKYFELILYHVAKTTLPSVCFGMKYFISNLNLDTYMKIEAQKFKFTQPLTKSRFADIIKDEQATL